MVVVLAVVLVVSLTVVSLDVVLLVVIVIGGLVRVLLVARDVELAGVVEVVRNVVLDVLDLNLLVVLLLLLDVEVELLLSGLQDVVEGPGDVEDTGGGEDLGPVLFCLLGSSTSSRSLQGPTGAAVTLSSTVSQGPKGPIKGPVELSPRPARMF